MQYLNINLSMICLEKQLEIIFSRLAFKSHGEILVPKVECIKFKKNAAEQYLHYKVSIANQIYRKYQSEGFRFSDQDFTPKYLAQEMAIHLKECNLVETTINQFGELILRPKYQLFQTLRRQIIHKKLLSNIQLDLFQKIVLHKYKILIIYEINQLDLSNWRIYHYLETICKKYALIENLENQKINKVIDARGLSLNQINQLINIIKKSKHKLFLWTSSILTGQKLQQCKSKNITVIKNMQELQLRSFSHIISGCFSHKIIAHEIKYNQIKDKNWQIIRFGSIYPSFNLSSNACQQHMQAIFKYSMQFRTNIPIQLKNLQLNNIGLTVKDEDKKLRFDEQILVLMDYLGKNQILDAISFVQYLKRQVRLQDDQKKIIDIADDTLAKLYM